MTDRGKMPPNHPTSGPPPNSQKLGTGPAPNPVHMLQMVHAPVFSPMAPGMGVSHPPSRGSTQPGLSSTPPTIQGRGGVHRPMQGTSMPGGLPASAHSGPAGSGTPAPPRPALGHGPGNQPLPSAGPSPIASVPPGLLANPMSAAGGNVSVSTQKQTTQVSKITLVQSGSGGPTSATTGPSLSPPPNSAGSGVSSASTMGPVGPASHAPPSGGTFPPAMGPSGSGGSVTPSAGSGDHQPPSGSISSAGSGSTPSQPPGSGSATPTQGPHVSPGMGSASKNITISGTMGVGPVGTSHMGGNASTLAGSAPPPLGQGPPGPTAGSISTGLSAGMSGPSASIAASKGGPQVTSAQGHNQPMGGGGMRRSRDDGPSPFVNLGVMGSTSMPPKSSNLGSGPTGATGSGPMSSVVPHPPPLSSRVGTNVASVSHPMGVNTSSMASSSASGSSAAHGSVGPLSSVSGGAGAHLPPASHLQVGPGPQPAPFQHTGPSPHQHIPPRMQSHVQGPVGFKGGSSGGMSLSVGPSPQHSVQHPHAPHPLGHHQTHPPPHHPSHPGPPGGHPSHSHSHSHSHPPQSGGRSGPMGPAHSMHPPPHSAQGHPPHHSHGPPSGSHAPGGPQPMRPHPATLLMGGDQIHPPTQSQGQSSQSQGSLQSSSTQPPSQSHSSSQQGQSLGQGPPHGGQQSQSQRQSSQSQQQSSHMTPQNLPPGVISRQPIMSAPGYSVTVTASNVPPQPYRQLKVEDALQYLEQVKTQFSDQPHVYNQFLDIMKDFKAQSIDTPGVIERVSTLFKGHTALILGFNTFLPPGYKIEIAHTPGGHVTTTAHGPGMGGPGSSRHGGRMGKGGQGQGSGDSKQRGSGRGDRDGDRGLQKQPIEFDQAITYVNKIKTRFSGQPNVYRCFLDILHTYQKEQHSIKEVYDQVASLFSDHTDLLDEFTQFLPDTAAAQVWNELKEMHARSTGGRVIKPAPRAGGKGKRGLFDKRRFDEDGESDKEGKSRVDSLTADVSSFFAHVKKVAGSKDVFQEFLKCVWLYSHEIISRFELQMLAQDLLGKHHDLMQELGEFLDATGGQIPQMPDVELRQRDTERLATLLTKPMSEIVQGSDGKCGPSYKELPPDYPLPHCSGRTELCSRVLNDAWVSVPTGSEDFSFKHMRKNQYEESLFRCEDDRFELDMIIETNGSTVRKLEPLLTQIKSLSGEEKMRFRLDDSLLNAMHYRAIERIYGENGPEVVDLFRKAPAVAIPIVLARLKQKDQEWRQAWLEMNKVWREIFEKNHPKSFDHRSFYFRQADKKQLSSKGLLADVHEKRQQSPSGGLLAEFAAFEEVDHHRALQVLVAVLDDELSGEAFGKALSFFEGFLLNFFSISVLPPRQPLKPSQSQQVAAPSGEGTKEDGPTPAEPNGWTKAKDDEKTDPAAPSPTDGDAADDVLMSQASTLHAEGDEDAGTAVDDDDDVKVEEDEAERHRQQWAPIFAQCKPSVVDDSSRTAGPSASYTGSSASSGAGLESLTYFYANDGLYCFFRLYMLLVERLQVAHEVCTKLDTTDQGGDKPGKASSGGTNPVAKSLSIHMPTRQFPEGRYETYLKALGAALEGTLDAAKYEDECRSLMGAEGYVLFTMEKLINKLVKQLQQVLFDPMCRKLVELYDFERKRKFGFCLASYQNDASTLLEPERSDRVYRFCMKRGGKLTVDLEAAVPHITDSDRSRQDMWDDYVAGILHAVPAEAVRRGLSDEHVRALQAARSHANRAAGKDAKGEATEDEEEDDVPPKKRRRRAEDDESSVGGGGDHEDGKETDDDKKSASDEDSESDGEDSITLPGRPVLPRNLRRRREMTPEEAATHVRRLVFRNALQYKVCARSFKLFYVEDTTDVLLRPGAQKAWARSARRSNKYQTAAWKPQRSKRFHEWWENRLRATDEEERGGCDGGGEEEGDEDEDMTDTAPTTSPAAATARDRKRDVGGERGEKRDDPSARDRPLKAAGGSDSNNGVCSREGRTDAATEKRYSREPGLSTSASAPTSGSSKPGGPITSGGERSPSPTPAQLGGLSRKADAQDLDAAATLAAVGEHHPHKLPPKDNKDSQSQEVKMEID